MVVKTDVGLVANVVVLMVVPVLVVMLDVVVSWPVVGDMVLVVAGVFPVVVSWPVVGDMVLVVDGVFPVVVS